MAPWALGAEGERGQIIRTEGWPLEASEATPELGKASSHSRTQRGLQPGGGSCRWMDLPQQSSSGITQPSL